jgi:hypothetical protein
VVGLKRERTRYRERKRDWGLREPSGFDQRLRTSVREEVIGGG